MPYIFQPVHVHISIWYSQQLCEPGREDSFYSHFLNEETVSERLSDLPKITEQSK